MSRSSDQINYLIQQNDTLRNTVGEARDEAADLRREVTALRKGIETTYEVVTVSQANTRNTRTFRDRFDALNFASGLRISNESVVIREVETRRKALYSDGREIRPFGEIV